EYHKSEQAATLPKMYGFEAEGAAAITNQQVMANPETMATAIRIGNPASWKLAEGAREESNGLITSVSEAEILDAFHRLRSQEGVCAEPGSCASIAGVFQPVKNGTTPKGSTVVAVLPGNGLKDPKAAIDS